MAMIKTDKAHQALRNRASLSGTSYYFVEQGKAAAALSRGRELDRLCP